MAEALPSPRSRRRRRILVLCLAAFLADMSIYLILTGVPFRAIALGAGPILLGMLPVARALPYSVTTLWAGGIGEGGDRLRLARGSLLGVAGVAVLLLMAPGIPWIFVALVALGIGFAFFWPALQATLADLAGGGGVTRPIGWFNISWSLGKATGYLVGGLLLSRLGFEAVFGFAALSVLMIVALLWFDRPGPAPVSRLGGPEPETGSPEPEAGSPDPRAARFRWAGWSSSAVAYGVGATLNHLYPKWLADHGQTESLFGGFLGLIFVFQTVAFAVLLRFPGWQYRAAPLLGAQVPLVAVLFLLPHTADPRLILALAPLVGTGLGTTYFASLFYSVQGTRGRGRRAGVHESVLGIGALFLPALGGLAAAVTGSLAATYQTVGAIALLAILGQGFLLAAPIRGTEGPRREYPQGDGPGPVPDKGDPS